MIDGPRPHHACISQSAIRSQRQDYLQLPLLHIHPTTDRCLEVILERIAFAWTFREVIESHPLQGERHTHLAHHSGDVPDSEVAAESEAEESERPRPKFFSISSTSFSEIPFIS